MYNKLHPGKTAPQETPLKRADTVKLFGGPLTTVTSYTEKYPGYSGESPYVMIYVIYRSRRIMILQELE